MVLHKSLPTVSVNPRRSRPLLLTWQSFKHRKFSNPGIEDPTVGGLLRGTPRVFKGSYLGPGDPTCTTCRGFLNVSTMDIGVPKCKGSSFYGVCFLETNKASRSVTTCLKWAVQTGSPLRDAIIVLPTTPPSELTCMNSSLGSKRVALTFGRLQSIGRKCPGGV
jgi:hypothetical protein